MHDRLVVCGVLCRRRVDQRGQHPQKRGENQQEAEHQQKIGDGLLKERRPPNPIDAEDGDGQQDQQQDLVRQQVHGQLLRIVRHGGDNPSGDE
jgi:hypothetical protein